MKYNLRKRSTAEEQGVSRGRVRIDGPLRRPKPGVDLSGQPCMAQHPIRHSHETPFIRRGSPVGSCRGCTLLFTNEVQN
jgi:hypothetical protein